MFKTAVVTLFLALLVAPQAAAGQRRLKVRVGLPDAAVRARAAYVYRSKADAQ